MTNHWKDLETKLVGSPTCLLLQFCLGMAPAEWKRPSHEVLKDDILQRQKPKWSYKVYLDPNKATLPACLLEWLAHCAESITSHITSVVLIIRKSL